MYIKKACVTLIASALLASTATVAQAASSIQQKIVYSATASFKQEYKLANRDLAIPLLFDLNNDGKDEIILSTAVNDMADADLYIGIYSSANGKKIAARHDEDTSGVPYEIRRIKNKSYKNCIALISHGTTGFGAFQVDVLTLKSNKLFSAASFTADGGGEGNIVVDVNKDGYNEFAGLEVESGLGADRLGFSGAANNITFRWDDSKKKYIQYGPDGVREDQRKAVSTLKASQALDILSKAYKVQQSFMNPLLKEKIEAAMNPYFTHNFINEFSDALIEYPKGFVPDYMESDDSSHLLPVYNKNKKVTITFSTEKVEALVTQTITMEGEEGSYSVTAMTRFVKTKYGWKIDGFQYK